MLISFRSDEKGTYPMRGKRGIEPSLARSGDKRGIAWPVRFIETIGSEAGFRQPRIVSKQ